MVRKKKQSTEALRAAIKARVRCAVRAQKRGRGNESAGARSDLRYASAKLNEIVRSLDDVSNKIDMAIDDPKMPAEWKRQIDMLVKTLGRCELTILDVAKKAGTYVNRPEWK